MTKHLIRRWFQFGILDLLVAMAIVGIVATLWRPAQAKDNVAPWVPGVWAADEKLTGFSLSLFPDGCFEHDGAPGRVRGNGWKLARNGQAGGSLLLLCGEKRLLLRSAEGDWVMDWLDQDGKVQRQLRQIRLFMGPYHQGVPHGVWTEVHPDGEPVSPQSRLMTYENGDLIDVHRGGYRDLATLNEWRSVKELPLRTAKDFPDDHWFRVHSRDDLTALPTR